MPSSDNTMPDDLIFEIFTRLPVKSLVRFTSISKSFSSLISSRQFIHEHTLRSPQKILIRHRFPTKILTRHYDDDDGIFYTIQRYDDDDDEFYTLHSEEQLCRLREIGCNGTTLVEFPYRRFVIIGSCNGILCLLYDRRIFILCNPAIRRKLILPAVDSHFSYSAAIHGFGYDSVSDDYKVVIFHRNAILAKCRQFVPDWWTRYDPVVPNPWREYDPVVPNPMVYTIKTGAWVEIASPFTDYCIVNTQSILLNGALHWVLLRSNGQRLILTFNMTCHVFGTIELPEEVRARKAVYDTVDLVFTSESLAVISSDNSRYRIWVMREYNNAESWVEIKFRVPLWKGTGHHCFQLMENGNLLFGIKGEGFVVYHPINFEYTPVRGFGRSFRPVMIEPYKESLEFLDEYFIAQEENEVMAKLQTGSTLKDSRNFVSRTTGEESLGLQTVLYL